MDTKLKKFKVWPKNSLPLRRSFVNIFWPLTLSGWGSPAHTINFTTYTSTYRPIMLKSLCLMVFIFKTYFDKIFAKLNKQGAAATFFLRYLKHFENGEISSAWKLLKLTILV